jgi:hypothetical protein
MYVELLRSILTLKCLESIQWDLKEKQLLE